MIEQYYILESQAGIEVSFEPFLLEYVLWAYFAHQCVSFGDLEHEPRVGSMASFEFTGTSQTDLAYSVGQSLGARSRYVIGELWAFHQGIMIAGAHCAYIDCSFYVVQLGMAGSVLEVSHGSVIGGAISYRLAPVCSCSIGAGYPSMLYIGQIYANEGRALTLITS